MKPTRAYSITAPIDQPATNRRIVSDPDSRYPYRFAIKYTAIEAIAPRAPEIIKLGRAMVLPIASLVFSTTGL